MPSHFEQPSSASHALWVRCIHWIVTASFLALTVSGAVILMCHPRLYWGEVGNDLTPAIIELPISRNHQHGGWTNQFSFASSPNAPISASRTFEIFNQNSWGRSLHFLAAWLLCVPGALYLVAGVATGHFTRRILPARAELRSQPIFEDLKNHLRFQIPPASGGPTYGVLQKMTYSFVLFLTFPLAVLTGLTMSPAVTAACPALLGIFGGHQSARTIHFFASLILVLFLIVHVLMIVRSGFKIQMRTMTLGRPHEN